ncbi:MAG TPA: Gfo/Idh/MocA family oxidoreductase, partial [Flavitalea sp.]|nr:Gfo/Idh/MocA family oxidoreductase [Flavitalea sp.]
MKTVHIDSSVQMPKSPGPIFIIGAGAIVRDAHLPAYVKAGWNIAGITDPEQEKAFELAGRYGIKKVYSSINETAGAAPANAVFDIAVPAGAITEVISKIPMGATVMIQKPMGNNIDEATEILRICKEKKF